MIYKKTILFLLAIIVFSFVFVNDSSAASKWLSSIALPVKPSYPTKIALDSAGNIYVIESTICKTLNIFNRHGGLKKTMGGFNQLVSVAVDSASRIYIGNGGSGSVDVYNADYSFSHKLGAGDGEFTLPSAIAVGPGGTIYVTDNKEHKVKVYNADGSSAFSFGEHGLEDGKFFSPLSLSIDDVNEEVFVTDLPIHQVCNDIVCEDANGNPYICGQDCTGWETGGRVQVFDLTGNFKRRFVYYPVYGGVGDPTALYNPYGITIDKTNIKMYVINGLFCVVNKFDTISGAWEETVSDPAHPMSVPGGIVIGKDNRMFVTSAYAYTGTIEVYGLPGYTDMTTSPSSLTFVAEGKRVAPQTITISNVGEGALNWTATVTSGAEWLRLSEANALSVSGTTGPSSSYDLLVQIEVGKLSAGTYAGSVEVVAESGAKDAIPVELTVISTKALNVAPSSLNFTVQKNGAMPQAQNITIKNSADDSEIAWSASTINGADAEQAASWFYLNNDNGVSPSSVSVTVDPSALDVGTHRGSIIIEADAEGSPASVDVTVTVLYAGTIKVTTNLNEAGFDITGPAIYSGAGKEWSKDEAAPGDYIITFKHVSGYTKPATKTFTLQTGKEIIIDGQYRAKPVATHIISGCGGTKGKKVTIHKLDGTFVRSFEPFLAPDGIRAAAGDIEGIGTDRIILTDHKREVKVYTSEGAGLASLKMSDWYKDTVAAAADINNDGKAEIIVGSNNYYNEDNVKREIKLLKYEEGKLTEQETLFSEERKDTFTIALGDIDGDGAVEFIMADKVSLRAFEIDLAAESKLTEKWAINNTYAETPEIAAGDVIENDDGAAEIALSIETAGEGKQYTRKIKILKGTGEESDITIDAYGDLGYEKPATVALGDTDSDGVDEIVTGAGRDEHNEALIRIYESNGEYTNQEINANIDGKFGVNVSLGRFVQ